MAMREGDRSVGAPRRADPFGAPLAPPQRPGPHRGWPSKRLRRDALIACVVVALIAAGVFLVGRGGGSETGPPLDASFLVPSTLAWSVTQGTHVFVTAFGVPVENPAVAIVIPDATFVDLPGGGPEAVGDAARTPGSLIAAVQATLDRPIEHFLLSDEFQLAALVERLGEIEVQTEAVFNYQGTDYGPGPLELSGGAVLAYLGEADDFDRTGRWEEVLTGLMSVEKKVSDWAGELGTSDDGRFAATMLARAEGGTITELPTAPDEDGTLRVDPKAVDELVSTKFPAADHPLVRIAVLNGSGRPGVGWEIGTLLASSGFRVVAAQNAESFNQKETQIVASGDAFLEQAQQVRDVLGVGTVYVGSQPTGIVDITIVVGKDLKTG